MVLNKDSTRFQWSWPWWRWILTVLNTLALFLSFILCWHYLKGGTMLGCGGGSPCETVLNSQWSMIAGILPVSGLAVGAYLAMLFAGFFVGTRTEISIRRMAWGALLVLEGSIAGSAVWFTFIQKFYIGSFCPYCMTTHITGLLLASLITWRVMKEFDNNSIQNLPTVSPKVKSNSSHPTQRIIRPLPAVGLVLTGLALSGILATCQVILAPSAVYRDGESLYKMPSIDYNTSPMVGSPDAHYVVTLLFDYQCTHCQKIHFMLNEVVLRYHGNLAFALCPTPLNTKCNPYIPRDVDAFKNSCELANIGLAVWVANRKVFPEFENWMFTFESGDRWHPRSLEAVRAKAIELVGQAMFDAALSDLWIEQYMQKCIQVYGQTIQNGKGGIPKMVYGSRWVIPEPLDADDLIMIFQKSLAMPEP